MSQSICTFTHYRFDYLAKENPKAIGDVNPNNARIKQLFKDQGGYGDGRTTN
jgi:hypothetical protein